MLPPAPDVPFTTSDGIILAGAGAGKTTTTVSLHVAARERGARVIVITFTNAAVNDYIRRANMECAGLASNGCVFTFHKLAAYILRDSQRCADQDVSLDTVVALAVEHVTLRGLHPDMMDIGLILVDEAQDCSRENYDLVRAIAAQTSAALTLIGDANQSLYGFRNAKSDFLLHHAPSGYRHELVTNWRSSPQIVEFANEFMRHPLNLRPCPGAREGPLPRLILCDSKSVARRAIEAARVALSSGRSVMIIGRSKRPRTERGIVARVGLQMVINDMSLRGVPYCQMFRESCDDDGGGATASTIDTASINVLTIHGSKGLEADTVVVIDALEERIGHERSPDQKELMYVAMSRARSELIIVNSRDGRPDSTLVRAVKRGLCTLEGDCAPITHAVRREKRDACSVTQLLSDRTLMDESELLEFSRELAVEPSRVCRPDRPVDVPADEELPDNDDLQVLYGTLAENCAQMSYNAVHGVADVPATRIMDRLGAFLKGRVVVPARHAKALRNLYTITRAGKSDPIGTKDIEALQKRLSPYAEACRQTLDLLDYLSDQLSRLGIDSAVLTAPSATQKVPVDALRNLLDGYTRSRSDEERLPHLFAACMFFYQLDHHAGYRWDRDYAHHVAVFSTHMHRIARMVKDLPAGCVFEKDVHFRHLRMLGRADIISSSKIVELKFTSQLTMTNFMQPCVYGFLDGDRYSRRCETWNLATGEKVLVKYNNSPHNRWRIFQRLARVTQRTVTVDDIVATQGSSGTLRLHCASLRATCDVGPDESVEDYTSFVTSGRHAIALDQATVMRT